MNELDRGMEEELKMKKDEYLEEGRDKGEEEDREWGGMQFKL